MKQAAVLIPLLFNNSNSSNSSNSSNKNNSKNNLSNYEVLFTQRSANLKHHSGENSFPGGGLDFTKDNNNLLTTALREAQEEINLLPEQTNIIYKLPKQYRSISNYMTSAFVGVINNSNSEVNLQKNPQEVAEIFTIPLSFLLQKNSFKRKYILLKNGRKLKFVTTTYNNHFIWGITGRILFDFINTIKKFNYKKLL